MKPHLVPTTGARRRGRAPLPRIVLALTATTQLIEAQAPMPTVPSGFRIDVLAVVPDAHAIATVPPALVPQFGDFVYVCQGPWDAAPSPTLPNDGIVRIDPATGVVSPFTSLPPEADPIDMAFGPGAPYTSDLYISENNRDGYRPGDHGGAIARVTASPGPFGEILVTATGTPNGPSEPTGIVFASPAFGSQLLVGNATNPPYKIQTVSPGGTLGDLVDYGYHGLSLVMGPGGAFGDDLYIGETWFTNPGRIARLATPAGPETTFSHVGADLFGLAFAPAGPFGENLYVALADRIVRVSPSGTVTPFAVGFAGISFSSRALAFAADGHTMYVIDHTADLVYRITDLGTIATSHVSTCAGALSLAVTGMPHRGSTLQVTAVGATGIPICAIGFPPRNTTLLDPSPCGVGCHVVGPAPGIGDLAVGGTRSLMIPNNPALVGVIVDFQTLDLLSSSPSCNVLGLPLDFSDIVTAVVD